MMIDNRGDDDGDDNCGGGGGGVSLGMCPSSQYQHLVNKQPKWFRALFITFGVSRQKPNMEAQIVLLQKQYPNHQEQLSIVPVFLRDRFYQLSTK